MTKELIFQLKTLALNAVINMPGDLLANAELVYQWLAKEALQPKDKQVASDF